MAEPVALVHGGNPDAQSLVGDAVALGSQMRVSATNFFGHWELAVLMPLPTVDGRQVSQAFAQSGKWSQTFEDAEEELHRLILVRRKLLLRTLVPHVEFPEASWP